MPKDDSLPEVVYHYTSMEALVNIMLTQSVWATSISYLNDHQEYTYFIDCAAERYSLALGFPLPPHKPEDPLSRPFITSFTKKRDSLTHWRSYCPRGNGVCIGFRTASLKRAHISELKSDSAVADRLTTFEEVRYIAKDDKDFIDDIIVQGRSISSALLRVVDNDSDEEPFDPDFIAKWVSMKGAFVKHPSFEDENEYRLSVSSLGRYSLLRFRTSQSTLIPYFEVRVPNSPTAKPRIGDPQDVWNAIESIVVGPTPNAMLSKHAIELLCAKHNSSATVECSTVSYRDW